MKILLINNHHYIKGGTERYYFNLSNLLRSHNHKVAFFSMKDTKNAKTRWSKYFVSNIDFYKRGMLNNMFIIKRIFYSLEAKRKISLLLDTFKPDLVHINNIYYYLSPSILFEIKKRKIPIVQTIHDYQLISPTINFFHDGEICEITKKKKYYKAILHKCVKQSFIISLIAAINSYVQTLFNFFEKNVDYYISPSVFLKKKLVEYGFSPKKIIILPNFCDIPKKRGINKLSNKFVLFFGRLTEEKGILFLLKLAKKLPSVNFLVAGEPNKMTINKIDKYKINNISLLGFLNNNQINKKISESLFTIIPSIWYEVNPYSILESYAYSKAVIASSIGGIPEIVKNGETGFTFKPNDIEDCENKVLNMWNNPKISKKMGENAKKYVKKDYNSKIYYQQLLKIYKKAINKYN